MSTAEIIRAWKDPEYRGTLAVAPEHPAGLIELEDQDLGASAAAGRRGFGRETIRHIHTHKTGCGTTFSNYTNKKCCP